MRVEIQQDVLRSSGADRHDFGGCGRGEVDLRSTGKSLYPNGIASGRKREAAGAQADTVQVFFITRSRYECEEWISWQVFDRKTDR